jgi:hypothetical protein
MAVVKEAGSIWETWYDVLFNPAAAMQTVAREQRKTRALLSLITGILPLWAAYFALNGRISELSGAIMGLHILAEAVIWVCGTALLHMISALIGGRGEATGLLCTLGYVVLPQIFLIPVITIAQCLPAGFSVVTIVAGLAALALWSLSLKVLAIRSCYGFTTAKSLLVLLTPFLGLLAGVAVTTLLLGISALTMVF